MRRLRMIGLIGLPVALWLVYTAGPLWGASTPTAHAGGDCDDPKGNQWNCYVSCGNGDDCETCCGKITGGCAKNICASFRSAATGGIAEYPAASEETGVRPERSAWPVSAYAGLACGLAAAALGLAAGTWHVRKHWLGR
jgi:hypothetical protein